MCGCRSRIPLINQSMHAIIELSPLHDTRTVAGASGEVVTSREDDPMCMHTGSSSSSTTDHSGSQ